MIEFEVLRNGQRAVVVASTDNIGVMTPSGTDRTQVVMRDGREFIALVPYADLRAAILRVRSGFETTVQEAAR